VHLGETTERAARGRFAMHLVSGTHQVAAQASLDFLD